MPRKSKLQEAARKAACRHYCLPHEIQSRVARQQVPQKTKAPHTP